ncbi:MAG: hypothetical protein IPJ74_01785 [Saprospiraceae bacterium]|nr:hypothetical protein [Saprospiraceae bacterium]
MARRTSGRIKFPASPKDILDLVQKVYEKHIKDGAASLLRNLEGDPWNKIGKDLKIAQAKHQEAEEYKRKMEEAYRERDRHLPRFSDLLRTAAALLKAMFRANPKRLGEWGFEVDDSVPVKKANNKE